MFLISADVTISCEISALRQSLCFGTVIQCFVPTDFDLKPTAVAPLTGKHSNADVSQLTVRYSTLYTDSTL